jgi:hypothetical protein
MTLEIEKDHRIPGEGRVHSVLNKHDHEDPDKLNLKRERFLALLRSRYGYTNEGAVDELTRLLKQFYSMNRSVGIHHTTHDFRHPQIDG